MERVERIDKFGHCVICTKNMITKRVVDGQIIEMFTPDHGHTEFLLNNGSRMQVCICRKCKDDINLSDSDIQEMVMESVQRGWELEVKALVADEAQVHWTKEFGEIHLKTMSSLNIDCHSENLDKAAVESRQKELISSPKELEVAIEDKIRTEISEAQ